MRRVDATSLMSWKCQRRMGRVVAVSDGRWAHEIRAAESAVIVCRVDKANVEVQQTLVNGKCWWCLLGGAGGGRDGAGYKLKNLLRTHTQAHNYTGEKHTHVRQIDKINTVALEEKHIFVTAHAHTCTYICVDMCERSVCEVVSEDSAGIQQGYKHSK